MTLDLPQLAVRLARAAKLVEEIRSCEASLDGFLRIYDDGPLLPSGFFFSSQHPPRSRPAAQVEETVPSDGAGFALHLAQQIKNRREALSMTQQELAEVTGIKRPNIARVEKGTSLPNMATVLKLAQGLKTSVVHLLGTNI